MNTGTVVSQHNGYIFVRVEGYEDNIFVHATAFPPGQRAIGQLRPGETIEVDAITYAAPRGYRAGFAKRLGAPEDVVMPPQRTDLKGYVDRMRTDRGFGYIRQESHGERLQQPDDRRSRDVRCRGARRQTPSRECAAGDVEATDIGR